MKHEINHWVAAYDAWMFFVHCLAGAQLIHIARLIYDAYFLTV